MSRIARIVVPDYPHHIIQRGNNKQNVFFAKGDREFYLSLLDRYSSECGCRVHAYCLMKNHIHLLLVPEHDNSLAKTMQKLSLRYTQHVNKKYARSGRLWECRFYSSVIDSDAYLWSVCRYIERNPVRAKVTEKPTEYRWSSAKINVGEKKSRFVEPIYRNLIEKKDYPDFLNNVDDNRERKKIRNSTYAGMPLGTDKFIEKISLICGVVLKKHPRGRPRKSGNKK